MADKFLGFLGDLVKPATGGGNYVYYSGEGNDFGMFGMFASVWKVNDNSATAFWTAGMATAFESGNVMGAGFDLSMKMTERVSGELVTVGEAIAEPSKEWTQITEEEFYEGEVEAPSDES